MVNQFFTRLEDRALLVLGGEDTRAFLQGLVSINIEHLSADRALHGAFLTSQGKYLYDFFAIQIEPEIYLDCEASRIDEFSKRLGIYKLRSKVEIGVVRKFQVLALYGDSALKTLGLSQVVGSAKKFENGIIYTDPRLALAGARCVVPRNRISSLTKLGFLEVGPSDYHRHRILLGLPDSSRDIEVEKATLLESGFEELNGVDFNKGCFMGQELTARTKYRGLIKKRLMPVFIDGKAPLPGTAIIQNEKNVGELRSISGDIGMALIRLEALENDALLTADNIKVVPRKPDWANF